MYLVLEEIRGLLQDVGFGRMSNDERRRVLRNGLIFAG